MQVAVGFRDDAYGAPLYADAWLNATTPFGMLSWRFARIPNGWQLFVTLLGIIPSDSVATLTFDAATGEPASLPLVLPPDGNCATQVEAPLLAASPALAVAGSAFTPWLVTAANGVAGSTIKMSVAGAAFTAYTGPVLITSCSNVTVSAYATKPGAVDSSAASIVLPVVAAPPPPGDLAASCAAIARRDVSSSATGPSAHLALGTVAGGRDASCNVLLTVQYGPATPPATGVAAFRLVSPTAGNVTLVAATGYDTTLNLGELPGAPIFTLYAMDAGSGAWALADPTAAPVQVGISCLSAAAAPSIVQAGPTLLTAPGTPAVVVTVTSGYAAGLNAATFVTTDGSDPTLAGGSRVWFTGVAAWNVTLQVRCPYDCAIVANAFIAETLP